MRGVVAIVAFVALLLPHSPRRAALHPARVAAPQPTVITPLETALGSFKPLTEAKLTETASRLSFDRESFHLSLDRRAPVVEVGPIRMTSIGHFEGAEPRGAMVCYRGSAGRTALVYRPTHHGVKEDLVVLDEAAFGDGAFPWVIETPEEMELRIDDDGSIGVYGPDDLLQRVTVGDSKSAALVAKARTNGATTCLVARLPAPVAYDADNRPLRAHYVLHRPLLSVVVERAPAMRYPVVVDPTITLTLDSQFRLDGTDEGLVKFGNDQVQRGNISGWHVPSWASAGTLGTARYTHGTAVNNKYFYVVGGHTGGSSLSSVEVALINDDGTMGPFSTTTAFPGPRHLLGVAAWNGYLYVTGGTDATAPNTAVFYAKLQPGGTILPGGWQTGSALPGGGRRDHACVAHNGFLYVVGGTDLAGVTSNVLAAAIRGDGSLGPWASVSPLTGFRNFHGAFAHDGFLYAAGGNNGIFDIATSEYARINADGTLSAWTLTTSLPSARSALKVAAVGGYAFAVGGLSAAQTSVVSAPILPGGGLGPWSATTSMTIGREHPGVGSYNGRLFVAGGFSGSTTPSVISGLPAAGQSQSWTTNATSLPAPRTYHRSVAYNGFLYAAGGVVGGAKVNDVLVAPINADGSVGVWSTAGTFTTARDAFGCVAVNGYFYVIGGSDSATARLGDAQVATINANGTLSGFTVTTALPAPRFGVVAVARNGFMYVLGGDLPGSAGSTDCLFTPINADGTLGASWTLTSLMVSGHTGGHAAVAWGGFMYVLGGNEFFVGITNKVEFAPINPNGTLGTWASTTGLPGGHSSHAAEVHDGYLYVTGGSPSGPNYDTTRFAPMNTNGTLDAWQTSVATMPGGRQSHGSAIVNGLLYCIGGHDAGPYSQVIYARVNTHGTVGAWTATTSFSPARHNLASVAHDGYLYLLGGRTDAGGALNDVQFALINADGTVGPWTPTAAYPTPRWGATAAVHNGFMYVLGGRDGPTDYDLVSYAPISGNGTVGPWTATTPLPTARQGHATVVHGGRIYVLGGSPLTNDVQFATLNADGTVGAWTATTSFPTARANIVSFAYNGKLYVNAGSNAAGALADAHFASINPDGTVGAWTATTHLPRPRTAARGFAREGFAYIIGGTHQPGFTNEVLSAPILENGALGAWQSTAGCITPRQGSGLAVNGGTVYLLGGVVNPGTGAGDTVVQFAPLRTPASRATYSRLIDLGVDATISTITTNGGGSNGTAKLEIRTATQADPAFGAATTVDPLTFGTPVASGATAQYLFLRYTLDDSMSVTRNPDATAHLAIDDITIAAGSPPSPPSNLEQRQDDDFVLVPFGGGTDTTTMFVHADISDPDGDDVRLHVEVKPVGVAFTGTATASSAFTTSPNSLSVQVTSLTAGVQYHWQAWTESIDTATSSPVSFGGNPDPTGVDFFVDQAPTAPTINQFQSDGVTPILDGGNTSSSTVVLKGDRNDPDALSLVLVELEIQPAATPFSDTATNTSLFGAPGTTASFTLSGLATGSYHWQMRCVDDNGKVSTPWTPFSASGTHFIVPNPNVPPDPPANLLQFENNGTTSIAFGSPAAAAAVKFEALLSDPNGLDTVNLQVELRPTGIAFTSPGTVVPDGAIFFETGLLPLGTQQIAITIPADGNYHWQARTVDNSGAASVWTSAGGNPDPDGIDISLDLVNDPPIVTTVGQFQSDGTTSIAVGGNATTSGVVFKATVTDPDLAPATVTLEIELRDTVTGLSASATHTAGPFASGSVISVSATPAIGAYHWAYRSTDGVTFSAWTSFGGNVENPPTSPADTDFDVTTNGGPTVASLAQFLADGTTPLPIGQSTAATVVLQGLVTDPEGQTVSLQVEVKPVGTAFDGTTNLTTSGLFVSGSTIQVTVSGLADGAYHWQARGQDVQATFGSFVSFGGNPEADPDFRVDVNNDPPTAPFSIGQYVPPGTVGLALGGAPFGRTVIIRALTTDEELGEVAFEVEVQPIGVPFTDVRTHPTTLSFGPPGAFGIVTLDDLSGGAYHWQIRATDALGQPSAWVSYGSNSESSADFEITATTAAPPNDPLNLQQRTSNDLVAINAGDTIAQAAVRVKALVVHPRTEIVKLQIEAKPLAQPFTGIADKESGFVNSGTVAEVLLFGFPNDSYHWQARTVDSKGTTSSWTSYGSGTADFIVAVPVNNAPDLPPYLLQHRANGITVLAVGSTTTQSTIAFHTFVADPDGDAVRFEVELKPVGIAFDGTLTGVTAFASSGIDLFLSVGGLPDGRYHWRARTVDANGASSAFVSYGGNPETDADFIVNGASNTVPSAAAALQQLRDNGTVAMDPGALAGPLALTFRSDADDADAGDLLRLEVEVRPTDQPLASVATHTGDLVPAGFVADAVIDRFVIGTSYHWQVRIVDVNGATTGWIEFGGNPAGETDFTATFAAGVDHKKKKCGLTGIELLLVLALVAIRRRRR